MADVVLTDDEISLADLHFGGGLGNRDLRMMREGERVQRIKRPSIVPKRPRFGNTTHRDRGE